MSDAAVAPDRPAPPAGGEWAGGAGGEPPAVAPPLSAGWTLRHALLTVASVVLVTRLLGLGIQALIITNDGVGYLTWGEAITRTGLASLQLPAYRTPGYPVLLAGAFGLLGVSAMSVMLVQRALALVTCLSLTWLAHRYAGPRLATLAGILAALDPWLFAFEGYALTEAPSTAVCCLLVALALAPRRPRIGLGLLLGALGGGLILVRPTFQVFVPFVLLAWLVATYVNSRRLLLGGLALLVGLELTLVPWVLHWKSQYGRYAIAGGSGATIWVGLARTGLLSAELPDDPVLRDAYAPFIGKPMTEADLASFYISLGGVTTREAALREWAMRSVRERPVAYALKVATCFAWMLNWYPDRAEAGVTELDWCLRRASADGPGANFSGDPNELRQFHSTARGGWLRGGFGWLAARIPHGIPQAPLAALALVQLVMAVRRRQGALALVLLGTFAFVGMHAVLLASFARYALPMWVLWYVTPATLAATWARRPPAARDTALDRGDAPLAARTASRPG